MDVLIGVCVVHIVFCHFTKFGTCDVEHSVPLCIMDFTCRLNGVIIYQSVIYQFHGLD